MSINDEVEEKRGPGRPKREEPKSEAMQMVEMLMEQNRLLVEQMAKQSQDATLALAAELRKPTEMEQKKLDDEKASHLKRVQMAVAVAKAQEAQDAITQAACTHTRTDGVTCFYGQVNSNGHCVPKCSRCGLQTSPIKATDQERVNGIQLQQRGNVTRESLENWARQRAS